MKYEVIVAGTVVATYDNKADAENRLYEVQHSFLAIVHPKGTMFIKEVEK